MKGVDAVAHLAWRARVARGESADPSEAHREVIVGGTKRPAEASCAGVKRLVFVSSTRVVGKGFMEAYSEEGPSRREDAYGIGKMKAEEALADLPRLGGRVAERSGQVGRLAGSPTVSTASLRRLLGPSSPRFSPHEGLRETVDRYAVRTEG